jgi:Zn-finger nucleic acid-binding protein
MNCPTCDLPLKLGTVVGQPFERCGGCGGEYFAHRALEELLSAHAAPPGARGADYLAWQAEGIPDVAAVRDATRDYLRDEDTLGQFFDAECVFTPDAKLPRKEIRERYARWSEERDERPVSAKTFAEGLRHRGVIERKVHTGGWHARRMGWGAAGQRRGSGRYPAAYW